MIFYGMQSLRGDWLQQSLQSKQRQPLVYVQAIYHDGTKHLLPAEIIDQNLI